MPMLSSPPSLTLLTRYVPASTGVHGNRLTSQRGVEPIHWGGVLVVFASWRAPCAPSVEVGPDIYGFSNGAAESPRAPPDHGRTRAVTQLHSAPPGCFSPLTKMQRRRQRMFSE